MSSEATPSNSASKRKQPDTETNTVKGEVKKEKKSKKAKKTVSLTFQLLSG
jgi:hypothetical protein